MFDLTSTQMLVLGGIILYLVLYFFGKKVKYSVGSGKKKKISTNKMEEKCRDIFEDIFSVDFHTIRPDWLKNPETMRNLELDGYTDKIKTSKGVGVAFEYNGSQHSFFNPHFHRSEKDFVSQARRDRLKRKICEERGILLVSIPYHVPESELENFIKKELRKHKPFDFV